MINCRYCDSVYQSSDRIVLQNEFWVANFDRHPVNPGHMKLICRQHRVCLSELSEKEAGALIEILREAQALIEERYHPGGYNLGTNEGKPGGQTVPHLHFHVIPRYGGDVEDPRGGIRTILPGGNYLEET